MEDLPKIKIKRENLVLVGLLIIALAIPLTVILLGVRQELRKGAAGVNGSILINNGAATTNSRNVTLTLTAPTSQTSLLKPNIKIPQAHAAGCTLSANPNPCTINPGESKCTSIISITTDDDIKVYVSHTPGGSGESLFAWYGAGSYNQEANWIQCGKTYTFVGKMGPNFDQTNCSTTVTAYCPVPTPTPRPPTPTPASTCYDSDGLDQYTKGYVDYTGSDSTAPPAGRYWDECSDNGWQVNEQWCNPNGLPAVTVFNCDYGCADGACRRSGATPTPRPPTPTPTPRPPTPTPGPTVVGMMVSNDGGFSGAGEESFRTTKSWTLTEGDGLKTVYAKFKWSNGTWTSPVSDTITLQTTGPTPTPTPTTPPGVTPTPTPTTPPGVTPTPTPPAGQPTAYCDKLWVGCTPHPAWARTHLDAYGHDSQGNEVAFFFKIDVNGGYELTSGVIVGGAGYVVDPYGEQWLFFEDDLNHLFPFDPMVQCCRTGTYTITAYVASVTRHPVTGQPTVLDNWSSPRSVTFNVHYGGPGATLNDATCNPSETGEIPEYEKPVISNTQAHVSGSQNVTITFDTNIEAQGRVYYADDPGLHLNSYTSPISGPGFHHEIRLQYQNLTPNSTVYYRVVASKPGNLRIPEARVYDPPEGTYSFTLRGGGGGLSASAADLNGNGDVEIGDWGSLVGSYAQEGEGLPADFNGNGEVDILDASQFIDAYRRYASD